MDRYSPDLGADAPQKLGRPTPGELLICPLLCTSDPLIVATTLKKKTVPNFAQTTVIGFPTFSAGTNIPSSYNDPTLCVACRDILRFIDCS